MTFAEFCEEAQLINPKYSVSCQIEFWHHRLDNGTSHKTLIWAIYDLYLNQHISSKTPEHALAKYKMLMEEVTEEDFQERLQSV